MATQSVALAAHVLYTFAIEHLEEFVAYVQDDSMAARGEAPKDGEVVFALQALHGALDMSIMQTELIEAAIYAAMERGDNEVIEITTPRPDML